MYNINNVVHNWMYSYLITYVLIGIPIFIGTLIVSKPTGIFRPLGLRGNILKALGLSLLFTAPMFIGGIVIGKLQTPMHAIDIYRLLAKTVFAGFFEELYFRAFLFGLLFKYTRIGFIPAILLGAIIFALGHIYQSNDVSAKVVIFLITFIGAGYFAWLYAEWKFNLWVPILMHTFMNASWMLYALADNAMGGIYSNIFRVVTIALSIVFTIIYKRRNNKKLEVNRNTLLWNTA